MKTKLSVDFLPTQIQITFFSIGYGWKIFERNFKLPFLPIGYGWQSVDSSSTFPKQHAIRAGRDADGCTIYVGRAFHENDLLPAKVIPDKEMAFVSFDGEEIPKTEFEVLRSGDFVWEFASNGEIPRGAIVIGKTVDGENLYMGRCLHEGTQTPGKVQASHGCLYIPFNGEELSFAEYEVLVLK